MNTSRIYFILLCTSILLVPKIFSQPTAKSAVEFRQITEFETNLGISNIKISADGSKIVFATSGPAVKIFTINSNGSNLKEVYDLQRTGTGPFIDINGNGEKVIWCVGYGEIFIANSDGSDRLELATLLPHPDPSFGPVEPEIHLPPRITWDGAQVYFTNSTYDYRGAGVWKIDSDNSNLKQVFSYREMAQQVFSSDGSEYTRALSFTDGFDISGDGSRIIVGTTVFGDHDRGDAIFYEGGEFRNLGKYAKGNQSFSTHLEANNSIMFRREFNDSLGHDEINVYFVPFGTGDPVKVISGLHIHGSPAMTQMSGDGNAAIVHGANGKLPITLVRRIDASKYDLVSINGLTRSIGGFDFSASSLPSINKNGDVFCFLSASPVPQIWLGLIVSDGTNGSPSISDVTIYPAYISIDRSLTSDIKAYVISTPDQIHTVTFEAVKDGFVQFRAITDNVHPFHPQLVDDGTQGDAVADDGTFTCSNVKVDLQSTPLGEYTIRIAAANTTLKEITMVDYGKFLITDQSTDVNKSENLISDFYLSQNYPNPFNPSTTIKYSIPSSTVIPNLVRDLTTQIPDQVRNDEALVTLKVYDVLGKEVAFLVNENQKPGNNEVEFNASELTSGIYFYRLKANKFVQTIKMLLLK